MISKLKNIRQAFVWIWLPNQTEPVVVGRIDKFGEKYSFIYGESYLHNPKAIALSPLELPLKKGIVEPEGMNIIHSCLRDAAPDAWGRRLIDYQYALSRANELDYMLLSGSNRIGGIDFQESSQIYSPRISEPVTLDEVLLLTEYVEKNKPLPVELQHALLHGTSVGGARPKALIKDARSNIEYVAKFSASTDRYNIIKAEYIAMQLARMSGIQVPMAHLKHILGRDVLLIERFDRLYFQEKTTRKLMLSALSLLKLNELEARYASYCDFASIIRKHFISPQENLQELYKRLIFNVLIGNTDDHARNHAAFWDGVYLTLTPAYDLSPQARMGYEATQAMAIEGSEGNLSKLTNVLSVCEHFQITEIAARYLMDEMIENIQTHWVSICDEAEFSLLEREQLWGQTIFNPFCFEGF